MSILRALALLAPILLLACQPAPPASVVAPTTPAAAPALPPAARTPVVAKSVAAAQIALTNLERLALRYTSLPRCGSPGATPVCSDPATVQRIKDYDNVAFDAVMRARRNSALLDFAVGAINALQAVIP